MTTKSKPFDFRFIDASPKILLELTNTSDNTLRAVEILTVFLKSEEASNGAPSQSHIRFDAINSMRPRETAVLSHTTWINGHPADVHHDQLERLKIITGEANPYVLDISWKDMENKTQFQRIPVGH
jgi:hypothetical protein